MKTAFLVNNNKKNVKKHNTHTCIISVLSRYVYCKYLSMKKFCIIQSGWFMKTLRGKIKNKLVIS